MIRLFRVFIPAGLLTLLVVDILIVLGCFLSAAFLFLEVDITTFLFYEDGLFRIVIACAMMILAAYFQDLYSAGGRRSHMELLHSLCTIVGVMFILEALITYASVRLRAPLRILLPASMGSVPALFAWRVLYAAVGHKIGAQRVLFVGNSELFDEIGGQVSRQSTGISILGFVDDSTDHEGPGAGKLRKIGPLSQLTEIAAAAVPDRILVGFKDRRARMPVETLLDLRFGGFAIEEVASFFEKICGRISSKDLHPSQLIFAGEYARPRSLLRDVADFTIALSAIIVTAPLMLAAAAAVKLSSAGPILFRQSRVGRNGVAFTLYKFRSMYADAEKLTGAVWSTENDARITRVGRILRQFRIDELPQLFNVLRGEMSIVGPRPERPEFVAVLSDRIPYYRQRHAVKPGITGWAQINYRYGGNFEDAVRKLEYDLYYIKYMSPSLDNYIMFATMKTMFLGRGAR